MTSRVLSRFLPVAEGDVSVFEAMRNEPHRRVDVESQRAPLSEDAFRDYEDDPEQMFFEGANDDPNLSPEARASTQPSPTLERIRPRWLDDVRNRRIDEDDDVPESLLLDPNTHGPSSRASSRPAQQMKQARAAAQWKAAQEQHRLHTLPPDRPSTSNTNALGLDAARPLQVNPQAQAMWMYTNAHNLDAFLLEVYQYYSHHGVWSIMLSRAISLSTELFVFSFAMFLSTCIDFSKIPDSKSTSEVMIPRCMSKASWLKNAALFFFVIYWLSRLVQYAGSYRRLFHMHDFYLHVLGINDQDIQTVSWVRVVDGLVKVQNANIATANPSQKVRDFLKYGQPQQRINAESIANRLMRKDNYYVAMYNKDIFDFTLPLPFVGNRQFYSKSLEWCIDFCLTNFIFDEQGSIRPFCLDVKNRQVLVDALRRRLQFAALTSVLIAPLNILRFCVMYFFKYYTEFSKNPSRISARSFTPFAEWKIREFNELEHLFERRVRQAYPFANDYLKQFPKDKTDQICRFIALVSGAIAAVLTLVTLWDHELFLGFEVTPGRTAVFWWTLLTGVFVVAHGALPDDNEVHDPVLHLREVLMFTHYMPAHWKDRLHSNEVRAEFSAMYQMKVLIFVEEILSLIVAPWILLRNARGRCERIIDFFREQTVHVEGVGYQCNFAVFGFKKDLNAEDPTTALNEPDGLRDDYFGLKDDKMAASVQNFMQYYSHFSHRQGVRRPQGWHPPPAWPPMLTQDFIGDDQKVKSVERPISAPQPAAGKRSPTAVRSPKNVAHDRGEPKDKAGAKGMTESRLMAQDSELDDFAKDAGLESDGEGDDDGGGKTADKNTGVLQMLAQFSRAQTEKGTGVNI